MWLACGRIFNFTAAVFIFGLFRFWWSVQISISLPVFSDNNMFVSYESACGYSFMFLHIVIEICADQQVLNDTMM